MDRELQRKMLRQMVLIRHFEEKCAELYAGAKIGGFLHLYIGEEAIAVGAINALEANDDVITHYRDHGHAIAKGVDINGLMAELCGRATGVCKGRGGSMHLADVNHKMWGGYAIVGGHLPLATGLAHSHLYNKTGNITVSFTGDASCDIGEFHEAMNFSALWKLPVLWIVENNLYGMGVPIAQNTSQQEIYKKAASYNMPSVRVDGMDVEAMHEAVTKAAAHIRSGNGPYFIEAMTYRFRGHSMADPELYRDKAEVEAYKKKDPINQYRAKLEKAKVLKKGEFDTLDAETQSEVNACAEFAVNSPFPDESSLFDFVYATPLEGNR
ncbi:MAG: pyruvate dehydrogenase (acetyl-transferring) E1 component subunit alpha [Candidatus Sericytochromatia bacterium]